MREIKFRGFHNFPGNALYPKDQRWICGYYFEQNGRHFIKKDSTSLVVEENTVGQYTGLKDKNGVEIFEGDIVKAASQGIHRIGLIKWGTVGFFIQIPPPQSIWNLTGPEESCEVIGNIHENPELLEDK